jgi:adenine phosphoribosyltransferase
MKYYYYEKYINKNTKNRNDVTPLFRKPLVFSNLINDLIKPFKKSKFNVIAGIDALGFIIGGAMSQKLKLPFVPLRKGGKLPGVKGTVIGTSFVDYTGNKKFIEINKGSFKRGDKVLIVDEWIETGAQVKAAIELVEKEGAKVVGISTLFAEKTPKTRILFEKYNLNSINE